MRFYQQIALQSYFYPGNIKVMKSDNLYNVNFNLI